LSEQIIVTAECLHRSEFADRKLAFTIRWVHPLRVTVITAGNQPSGTTATATLRMFEIALKVSD
jgi:hypothetical protein